jgi:hypothetical protein
MVAIRLSEKQLDIDGLGEKTLRRKPVRASEYRDWQTKISAHSARANAGDGGEIDALIDLITEVCTGISADELRSLDVLLIKAVADEALGLIETDSKPKKNSLNTGNPSSESQAG